MVKQSANSSMCSGPNKTTALEVNDKSTREKYSSMLTGTLPMGRQWTTLILLETISVKSHHHDQLSWWACMCPLPAPKPTCAAQLYNNYTIIICNKLLNNCDILSAG